MAQNVELNSKFEKKSDVYYCELSCGYQSQWKHNINRHMLTKHTTSNLECITCKKIYKHISSYKKHSCYPYETIKLKYSKVGHFGDP